MKAVAVQPRRRCFPEWRPSSERSPWRREAKSQNWSEQRQSPARGEGMSRGEPGRERRTAGSWAQGAPNQTSEAIGPLAAAVWALRLTSLSSGFSVRVGASERTSRRRQFRAGKKALLSVRNVCDLCGKVKRIGGGRTAVRPRLWVVCSSFCPEVARYRSASVFVAPKSSWASLCVRCGSTFRASSHPGQGE